MVKELGRPILTTDMTKDSVLSECDNGYQMQLVGCTDEKATGDVPAEG